MVQLSSFNSHWLFSPLQVRSQKNIMTEAMSTVKFSSSVVRVFMITINNKNEQQQKKNMTEASPLFPSY